MVNSVNGFTASVQSGTLQVSVGPDTFDMALAGLDYGLAPQSLGTALTTASGNRVDLNYGTLDEWYVNGPVGLEQGFTVPVLPSSEAGGSLAVELSLGGDLTAVVSTAGNALTLTRPDGSAALGYNGLTACDATRRTLPATLEVQRINGHQELLIHVDTAGAHGPITIDPFVQAAKLTASDGAAGDNLGCSVAISGSTVVVGSPDNTYMVANPIKRSGAGLVYVFTEPSSGWADMTETATLIASDGSVGNEFGASVSISGNTLVVGAPSATVGENAQGAAYVFTGSGSAWTQSAKLTASDGEPYDDFGRSVSISGITVVVGAQWAKVNGNADQGAAYVFAKPSSGWANMTQTAKLTASSGAAGDYFGQSVSISGNAVVVGAWGVGGSYQGAAYVFTEPSSGWANMTQTAEFTASDAAAYAQFGWSVSISGNTVVVGANYATLGNSGLGYQGAAYVFTEPASGWATMTQTAELTASDGTYDNEFGNSVSISGNTVAVGAPDAAVGGNDQQGATYVFTEPSSGWDNMTETANVTASDGTTNNWFGTSVVIGGNIVVVGAPGAASGDTSDLGAAYLVETPAPTVTGISPAAGPLAGGTSMTITGTNLANATAVMFGQTAASIVSDSGTQITVTSPPGSGTVDVTVVTPEGISPISSADQFSYYGSVPAITSISPTRGPVAGGTLVTITGTSLANATAVMFGQITASIVSDSATQILLETPAETAAIVDVTVTTSNGTSTTSSADRFAFVYPDAPAITSVNNTTFTSGMTGSFSVTDTGYPTPTFSESGALPSGVSFTSAGVLNGTPTAGTSGTYPIVITASNGLSPNATQAFTLFVAASGGQATLETELTAPSSVWYDQAATLSLTYKNTGTAAMAAPLLVLSPTQDGRTGALLTLDPSLKGQGLDTATAPNGYSETIDILGSGVMPGVLGPGESVTVPVYYGGWLTNQWEFSAPNPTFSVGALTEANTVPIQWSALKLFLATR